MFQVSFCCAEVSTSIPRIKWSICSCVLLFNVWRGRGFDLISMWLLRLRCCLLLFYLQFCVRLFPFCFRSLRKLDRNWVQLVVLVAVDTAAPCRARFVRVVILVVKFSRVYADVVISVVVGVHSFTICTVRRVGRYSSRCYCYIVEFLDVLLIYVTTNSYCRCYCFS